MVQACTTLSTNGASESGQLQHALLCVLLASVLNTVTNEVIERRQVGERQQQDRHHQPAAAAALRALLLRDQPVDELLVGDIDGHLPAPTGCCFSTRDWITASIALTVITMAPSTTATAEP